MPQRGPRFGRRGLVAAALAFWCCKQCCARRSVTRLRPEARSLRVCQPNCKCKHVPASACLTGNPLPLQSAAGRSPGPAGRAESGTPHNARQTDALPANPRDDKRPSPAGSALQRWARNAARRWRRQALDALGAASIASVAGWQELPDLRG
ncbi:hypothetical protein PHYPSEUDO_006741 [Phytophthora pseudosyringae]|uniref:Uncharacterized protein n=1 Tax=Phytophthora pseudosyringae TaxID=221518 RepID=A0A8T1VKW4_9STRA|nr:hypothetical protein PHYPSEUDO_006741 [Phytophthora pseudosyringae]